MLRKKDQMSAELASNVKGGEGTIKLINALEMDEMYGMGRFFGVTVIPPGCSTGLHTHISDFETYYIIKGKAEINENGTKYVVESGDVSQCPPGSSHAIKNIGDEDLEYLAVILYTEKR